MRFYQSDRGRTIQFEGDLQAPGHELNKLNRTCDQGQEGRLRAHVWCMHKKLVVIERLRDYERWKKRHGYGKRSIVVESAISSFKRTFRGT